MANETLKKKKKNFKTELQKPSQMSTERNKTEKNNRTSITSESASMGLTFI